MGQHPPHPMTWLMTNASSQPCIHRLCSGLAVSTPNQHPVAFFHTKCRCIDCWWVTGTGNTNPAHPITYLSHLKAVYASNTMWPSTSFIRLHDPKYGFSVILLCWEREHSYEEQTRSHVPTEWSHLRTDTSRWKLPLQEGPGRPEEQGQPKRRGRGACWLHPAWTMPSRIFSQTPHTSVPPQSLHAACPFLFPAWATHNWQCKGRFSFQSIKYSQEHHKLHASPSFS